MPARVLLINPKYPANVGACLRAANCYGAEGMQWTGTRVPDAQTPDFMGRLPREERMKQYTQIEWGRRERPFDGLPEGMVPVAVEVLKHAESLISFEHPPSALYVFGPEDGGLTSVTLRHCHRFISIPSQHCLNLSAAVYTVLYDRHAKLNPTATLASTLMEMRGHA